MNSDRWFEQCKRCGTPFDVGLHTRQRDYCNICQIELDLDGSATPELGIFSVHDKLPKPGRSRNVMPTPPVKSGLEKSRQSTLDDREWEDNHPYWGTPPKNR